MWMLHDFLWRRTVKTATKRVEAKGTEIESCKKIKMEIDSCKNHDVWFKKYRLIKKKKRKKKTKQQGIQRPKIKPLPTDSLLRNQI